MCCLNFCKVHFLVLLLLYLVDVLSEILFGPLPGLTPIIFGGCVVSTLIGSSSWFYSRYIRWMGCLKLYWVQFLVLLLLSLVDVLSELLLGPVPSFTPTIFGGCVVWTCVGSSSWFYSHYIWWIWSGSLSYSRSIWWMCFLNFSRVQFVVLLPLWLVYVLSERLKSPVLGLPPVIFGWCVVWTFVWACSWFYSRYIWWMYCLNFYRVHFLVLLLLYLVDVLSERL